MNEENPLWIFKKKSVMQNKVCSKGMWQTLMSGGRFFEQLTSTSDVVLLVYIPTSLGLWPPEKRPIKVRIGRFLRVSTVSYPLFVLRGSTDITCQDWKILNLPHCDYRLDYRETWTIGGCRWCDLVFLGACLHFF